MHLELVELLRCPVQHRESVLVAATDVVRSRFVIAGVLGCPECGAEYPIANGVTYFDHDAAEKPLITPENFMHGFDSDAIMRVAAQLNLTEGRSTYALIGYSLSFAALLRRIVPARLLVINPQNVSDPQSLTQWSKEPAGILVVLGALPIVSGKLDGVAIAEHSTNEQIDDHFLVDLIQQSANTLRVGGRLVAPIELTIPNGFRELARDESVWVVEREPVASAPVELRRR